MSFNVLKFWTDYTPNGVDADGKPKMRAVDMVEYAPIGKANMQVCREAVARLAKVIPIEPGNENIAVLMANKRWQVIKTHYDAWKSGNDVPTNGTPLAAWPGVTAEQVQVLKAMGIRTIEDIRDASEGIITRFPFPNARELQRASGLFLASFDKDKVAKDMARMEAANAEKDVQLEELRQMVLEMQANQSKAKTAKVEKAAA